MDSSSFSALSPLLRSLLLQHAREDLQRARTITDLEQAALFLRSSICDGQQLHDEPSHKHDNPAISTGASTSHIGDSNCEHAGSSDSSEDFCLEVRSSYATAHTRDRF